LCIARDISDRKAAEEALRRSEAQLRQQALDLEHALEELQRTQAQLIQTEKMSSLGQLVAGVAHEINNPISFIYGNLKHARDYFNDLLTLIEMYQQHYPQPSPVIRSYINEIDLDFLSSDLSKLLESMRVGADRIRQIVASLRTFARLDEAEFKAINIHDGLESTLTVLQSRLNKDLNGNKIQVVKEYGALPLVECYAGDLNQALFNLLNNAIDSLEDAAKRQKSKDTLQLKICTKLIDNQGVQICIMDNGLGVSEKDQSRLFDPFFTTKPVGSGTGLGLSTSYQIITKQHKGSLRCISTLNQGATFVIEIPLHQRMFSHRS
jgi:two-component system NtrC family sensor kinase